MKPHEYVILEIARERERQINGEGWTPEHDDGHADGEMAQAAACYATDDVHEERIRLTAREILQGQREDHVFRLWPWDLDWWKPTTQRRNLVKAAALIVAEIERLDRIATGTEVDRG